VDDRERLVEGYMKFRPQRGGLIESMNAVVLLDPTLESLARHLNVPVEDIECYFYGYDTRILWDTYAVTVDGDIVGFTDERAL
jgi:hypothetical protein